MAGPGAAGLIGPFFRLFKLVFHIWLTGWHFEWDGPIFAPFKSNKSYGKRIHRRKFSNRRVAIR
jgi:hypothetical protein